MRSTLTALVVVVASMGAACSFDSGGLPGGFGGGGSGDDDDDDDDGTVAGADASSTQGPAADASMPPTGTDATPAPLPVDAAPSPPPPPPPPPPVCDLVTSAGCAPGWACRVQWPNGHVACEPAGSFGHGHGCDGANDCAPGLDCVGVPFAGLCLRYCWVGAPDACGSCSGWDPPVVVGGREAGVCTF